MIFCKYIDHVFPATLCSCSSVQKPVTKHKGADLLKPEILRYCKLRLSPKDIPNLLKWLMLYDKGVASLDTVSNVYS